MSFNIVKRYIALIFGLFIMAFGVAFSIKGNLGTSPISSLPYVTSLMSGLTVGQTTIILHCTLILIQILLLRKDYQPIQLMQLPVAFIFGYMTDFAVWAVSGFGYTNYAMQWIYCIIGIVFVGVGVSFEVVSDVVTLAGEGTVLAICNVTEIPFGKTKISFDTTLVIISIILSVVFLHGLFGVREGTIAAAFFVGMVSKTLNPILENSLEKVFG